MSNKEWRNRGKFPLLYTGLPFDLKARAIIKNRLHLNEACFTIWRTKRSLGRSARCVINRCICSLMLDARSASTDAGFMLTPYTYKYIQEKKEKNEIKQFGPHPAPTVFDIFETRITLVDVSPRAVQYTLQCFCPPYMVRRDCPAVSSTLGRFRSFLSFFLKNNKKKRRERERKKRVKLFFPSKRRQDTWNSYSLVGPFASGPWWSHIVLLFTRHFSSVNRERENLPFWRVSIRSGKRRKAAGDVCAHHHWPPTKPARKSLYTPHIML